MKLIRTALAVALCATAAEAQIMNDNRAIAERLDRIEDQLQQVQRYAGRTAEGQPLPEGAAGIEVRLTNIEDQLRQIRGQMEENSFTNRRTTERMDKLQQDLEYRLNALEASGAKPAPVTMYTTKEKEKEKDEPDASGVTSAGSGTLDSENEPRDLYNQAFKLLNQTRYEDAAKGFAAFIAKYPKDPLVGNAYYWLGETYYIKRDYVSAADQFRQGFETLPSGPKAPDNLLKLSMSLSALKRDKEACIVLDQLLAKFANSSHAITNKAQEERTRIGCR